MELANYIETAMKSILKNPIYEVLSEIKITKILKQSNFVKREVGYPVNITQLEQRITFYSNTGKLKYSLITF
jgi:hypothetical protein